MTQKVVIWGYPPNTHTHSYVHLGFAKAFSYLDYDVVWCDDDPEYAEDVGDAIVISEKNCSKHLPILDSSKYFIHNIKDGFHSHDMGDNVHNLLVYHEGYNWSDDVKSLDDHSWYHEETKTAAILWATDLLPGEIEQKGPVMYDDTKGVVNYMGTLTPTQKSEMGNIVSEHNKRFNVAGGYSGGGFVSDKEAVNLIKNSYLNFDLRPDQHVNNGYVPCRIFKCLSYGCWVGTNSEKILKFFEGRITACNDLKDLYNQTEEDYKNATMDDILDNKQYIQDNHTYVNRAKTLLNLL